MKTQAEPRALHSYYIKDMARNYATDCSDPSLEEDEAVRTHGLSSSEKRESVRLHHEEKPLAPETEDLRRQHHVPRSSTHKRFTHWSCPDPLQVLFN